MLFRSASERDAQLVVGLRCLVRNLLEVVVLGAAEHVGPERRAGGHVHEDALVAPPIVMRGSQYVIDWEPGTLPSQQPADLAAAVQGFTTPFRELRLTC